MMLTTDNMSGLKLRVANLSRAQHIHAVACQRLTASHLLVHTSAIQYSEVNSLDKCTIMICHHPVNCTAYSKAPARVVNIHHLNTRLLSTSAPHRPSTAHSAHQSSPDGGSRKSPGELWRTNIGQAFIRRSRRQYPVRRVTLDP